MTKVLWIINIPIPSISNDLKIPTQNICGWITGFANEIGQQKAIDLTIAFPLLGEKRIISGLVGNIKYYSFYQPKIFWNLNVPSSKKTKLAEEHISEIIKIVKPDILHVFGTEYVHSLMATKIFNNPERTVVNIQGLTSVCSTHYISGLPINVLTKFALSNIVRGNVLGQKEKFRKRGLFEIETLRSVGNVIGRTDWDKACSKQINPNVKYYFCNENLRDEFYKHNWNIKKCKKNSIFMSQASSPIKGIHFMLQALPEIIKRFPDTHLYIAGNDLTRTDGLYNKLRISSYGLYIKELIKKFKVHDYITFVGPLNEMQICRQFLNANVFVSASTIENESNSLSEAKILGVPCVASYVGGVTDRLIDKNDGFFYQADAPYMLAYYICEIFDNDELALKFSKNARERALKTHDREENLNTLLNIYKEISNE